MARHRKDGDSFLAAYGDKELAELVASLCEKYPKYAGAIEYGDDTIEAMGFIPVNERYEARKQWHEGQSPAQRVQGFTRRPKSNRESITR